MRWSACRGCCVGAVWAMSDHDPLCSRRRHDDEPDHYGCAINCTQVECNCELIAAVREDERQYRLYLRERMKAGLLTVTDIRSDGGER